MAGRLRETELRITVEVFFCSGSHTLGVLLPNKSQGYLLSVRTIVLAGVGNLVVHRLRGHTPRVCKARSVLLAHTTCAADGLLDPCAPGAHYLFRR